MVTCGRCGADNAVGMRYCTNCGAELAGGTGPTPPAAAGVRQASGRRPVSPPSDDEIPSPPPDEVSRPTQVASSAPPSARTFGPSGGASTSSGAGGSRPFDATHGSSPGAGAALNRTYVQAPPDRQQAAPARLVALLKDGGDGNVYPVSQEQMDVGRAEGDVVFPDDPYLDPRHARIFRRGGGYVLRDLDTVNGIYVRIREPVDLQDGDMLLVGQQVLRFQILSEGELPLGPATVRGTLVFGTPEVPRVARLLQYTTEGVGRDVHYLYREQTIVGRETGDLVFPDDPFLSRRHASITHDRTSRRYVLKDLGSSNGTSVRFRGERPLRDGDQFRLGRHLFRFDLTGDGTGTDGGGLGRTR